MNTDRVSCIALALKNIIQCRNNCGGNKPAAFFVDSIWIYNSQIFCEDNHWMILRKIPPGETCYSGRERSVEEAAFGFGTVSWNFRTMWFVAPYRRILSIVRVSNVNYGTTRNQFMTMRIEINKNMKPKVGIGPRSSKMTICTWIFVRVNSSIQFGLKMMTTWKLLQLRNTSSLIEIDNIKINLELYYLHNETIKKI